MKTSKLQRRQRIKLKPLYAAMLPLMIFGMISNVYSINVIVEDNVDDGSTTALGNLDRALFTAPAAGIDEVITAPGGNTVGFGGIAVSATTANGVGKLELLGSNAIQGDVGATGNRLGLLTGGVAGNTVSFFTSTGTGGVFINDIDFSGTGTIKLNRDITVTNDVDFLNQAGTLEIVGSALTGNISSTGGVNGTVSFSVGSSSVSGSTTAATINAGGVGSTATLTGAVTATTLNLSSTGTVNLQTDSTITNIDFNNLAGTVRLADTVDLTGNVISTGGTNGSLTFLGSGSVSGNITAATINAGVVASTVTLTGAVTATTLKLNSTGTVNIGNGGTSGSIVGNITNSGALIFNRSDALSYGGNITGTGTLTKLGAGTTTLTGANTYSGGTTISAGTLQIGNGGTAGSITGNITNNSALIFNRSDALNYSGNITGTGTLTKLGADTTTLTGTNTYSGGTTISAGTLQIGNGGTAGSITGNITNNSALIFNRSDAVTYGNVISSTGSFTQTGAGSTNLTGANTYSGTTTINGGTLFMNGSNSNSTTTINAGGTLGGSGTVGNVFVNGGIFAPGNSIGTTNVAGSLSFAGGGHYNVEVNAAGNSDKIVATGTATLTSGIVNVQPEAGTYAISTDYTILTATGGLIGTFASVNSNLAFLTPTLTYDATNVFLKLTRNDVSFSSVANTQNQKAVSTVLGNNANALSSITNTLLTLSNSRAQQAFDSLTGVQHTHGQVLTNKLSQQFLQLLFTRGSQNPTTQLSFNAVQAFDPLQGDLLADNSNNWETAATDLTSLVAYQRGWWLQGFGGFGDIDATTNASGAEYDTQGLAFGVDTEWRDFVVGLAGSYASSDADTFGGSQDVDSFQAATYASWERDAVYINARLGIGLHQTDASRAVVVGTTTSTATSEYDTYHVSAAIEGGKEFTLAPATSLTPFVGVEYTHSNRDDFTETGAGAANLSVNDEDQDSLRTKFGLRLSHDITTRITPLVSVAYVREMMDNVSRTEAAFTTVPTSTFRIDGVDLDRDRVQVAVGVTGHLNERTTLNVAYNGELADSDDNHGFTATIRLVW